MKTRIFFLFAIVLVAFTACNLDGSSNYTPDIMYSCTTQNKHDTLYSHLTDESGVYRLDTVHVGDTLMFKTFVTGYSNNLVSFFLTNNMPDSVSQVLLTGTKVAMDSIFLPTSNYAKGEFYIRGTSTGLIFPFKYVVKRHSTDAKLKFVVQSDANFKDAIGSNTNSFSLLIPVK